MIRDGLTAAALTMLAYAAYRGFSDAQAAASTGVSAPATDYNSVTTGPTTTPAISNDQDVLARTIWGEARGAGIDAQIGVGSVVRNRVEDPQRRWPSTYAAVCQQPLQFSAWNVGDPNLPKLLAVTTADPVFQQCLSIAAGIMAGSIADDTGGAQFYFDDSIAPPSWAANMTMTAKIGSLNFYRE